MIIPVCSNEQVAWLLLLRLMLLECVGVAVVMKDAISRRSRGFGFITFAEPSAVDRVLEQPNHVLDNRRVEAKRAVSTAISRLATPGTCSNR